MTRRCCLRSSLLLLMTIYISPQKTTDLHILGRKRGICVTIRSSRPQACLEEVSLFLQLGRWQRNHLANLLDLFIPSVLEGDGRKCL